MLAFSLVISLLLASCGKAGGDDTDDTGIQTGNGAITGGSNGCTITANVTYDEDISNLTEAKSITDFGYTYYRNEQTQTFLPISNVIPNSSVIVSGGKATIKLGVPKSKDLDMLSEWFDDRPNITITPSNAKIYEADSFSSSDEKYDLYPSEVELLVYVDRDVTIKGTDTGSWTDNEGKTHTWTEKYDVSLKAGWNYLIWSETENSEICTASKSLPGGSNWTVNERW
jgi:hypothetical protein